MNKQYTVFFIFIFIFPSFFLGQHDTILLNKVTVKAVKDNDLQYIDTINMSSLNIYSTNTILNTLSGMSIKNYGVGGLTSMSLYALPSRYNAVYINDIPLSSVMSGGIDASIIPLDFFNSIKIKQGGESPVSMKFFTPDCNKIVVESMLSSAKNIKSLICLPLTMKNNKIFLFISGTNNKNEYNLFNNYIYPPKVVKITGYPSYYKKLLFTDKIAISNKSIVNVNFMYFSNLQNIFPTMTQEKNNASLFTEFYGNSAKYKVEKNKSIFTTLVSFSKHYLLYSDSSKNIFSHNNSYDFRIKQNITTSILDNFNVKTAISYKFEKAITNNYNFSPYRNTYTVKEESTYQSKYLGININGRLLSNIKNIYPFSYGATFFLKNVPYVQPKISFEHNIVLPTFNDLYWYPGGNIDLKPEKITFYSLEFGFFNNQIRFFATHSSTNNEIIWKPVDNSTLWQATNYEHTHRTVLSIIANYSFSVFNRLKIKMLASYDYVNAKDDNGKYLIYVPLDKGAAQIDFVYNKKLGLSTHYTYYGVRYTSFDNYFSLPPFNVYDLNLSYTLTLKKIAVVTSFVVNNITNTAYEYIPSMPMPLRYYSFDLKFMFNLKK